MLRLVIEDSSWKNKRDLWGFEVCAILDANSIHEVFRVDGSEAGKKFYEWLRDGRGRLVVGGKVHEEFKRSLPILGRKWAQEAQLSGKLRIVDKDEVKARTEQVEAEKAYKSDDPHILALAQISGARRLYSNDADLQQDFKNPALVNRPRGKVYSTLGSKEFEDSHKKLLANKNLCRRAV